MIILGIDVGVRNLGMSIIEFGEKKPRVIWGGVLDIDPDPTCVVCGCKAKVKQGDDTFCLRHYCKEKKSKKIKRKRRSIMELTLLLYGALDSMPILRDVDQVILENQPCRMNPHLKTVEILLFGYFVRCGVKEVNSMAAAYKFKITSAKVPKNYNDRKKLSIQLAREWLVRWGELDTVEKFDCCKKKDDFADSILICCARAKQKSIPSGFD